MGTSVRCSRVISRGSDRRLGSPGTQPQGRGRLDPAGFADGDHRPVGIRQIVARVRHDLRRGTAPLRRVAVGVRAPVPGADGQAGRRLDRGPVAGDLDRPEDDLAQPALDGRDGHGDLRLPAAAVGADRPSALPHLRPADHRPVGRADHRPGDGARGGHPVHGDGADRPRAQGRVRQAVRGAADRGLRPRQGQRRAPPPRRGDRARQEVQARHLGRRRPAGDEDRPAQAAGRLGRDGRDARRRAGGDRTGSRPPDPADAVRHGDAGAGKTGKAAQGREARDPDVLRAVRLPGARAEPGRARAADLLVQRAARRLPALHRPGLADGDRPRAGGPGSDPVDRGGGDRAVGGQRVALLRPADAVDLRALRRRSGDGVAGPAGRGA